MPQEDSGIKEPNLRTPSALALGVCQCIENNISLPKQISALIKIFVELREEDQKNRK